MYIEQKMYDVITFKLINYNLGIRYKFWSKEEGKGVKRLIGPCFSLSAPISE